MLEAFSGGEGEAADSELRTSHFCLRHRDAPSQRGANNPREKNRDGSVRPNGKKHRNGADRLLASPSIAIVATLGY